MHVYLISSVFLLYIFSTYSHGARPPIIKPKVLRVFPHSSRGFTQGLCYHEGFLYEGTGLYSRSNIYRIQLEDGSITQSVPLNSYFGEGIAILNNRLIQLTWKGKTALVYSLPQLNIIDTLVYTGEGWGLTNDPLYLIMSNWSDTLYFRDSTFTIHHEIQIKANGQPVEKLNELEYAENNIFANIWHSKNILEINPKTGEVLRIVDCEPLFAIEKPKSSEYVLNGIAYNPTKRTFYLTGKCWSHIFEVYIPQITQ